VTDSYTRYVEFVLWVGSVATALTLALAIPAFAVGDGLLTLKYALFVVGFLLFGVGSFAIQPSPRGRGPVTRLFSLDINGEEGFAFERRLESLPPLRGKSLPAERRVSRSVKVFVTSLVVLCLSMVLEFGLGVGVG